MSQKPALNTKQIKKKKEVMIVGSLEYNNDWADDFIIYDEKFYIYWFNKSKKLDNYYNKKLYLKQEKELLDNLKKEIDKNKQFIDPKDIKDTYKYLKDEKNDYHNKILENFKKNAEPKKAEAVKKEPVEKKNDKDINYKKVFKVFDEYYKLVNVEYKKYLKGQISSDELDEKLYNELKDEYDYSGLAISLGLYKDIRGNRYIDPDIEKKLKKDSKNYQEYLELIKKPPPIDPIEDDEDIDDWEGEDLRCYLDNYLRYGKPVIDPWSEVKKGLAKEHQTFDKYKNHLLQGYKTLLTTEKDKTLKNCGKKKFDEAMKQYKSIMNAKNYKEYYQLYKKN
jgi:hypothetical protein